MRTLTAWIGVWVATLLGACGGGNNDQACKEADESAQKIKNAAMADGISPEGACTGDVALKLDNAGYAGGDDQLIRQRADQYAAECAKYKQLVDDCDG